MVFRPSDSPDIQPSRMPRMAFDLGAGGALTMFGSGPDDRRVPQDGHWRLDGEHLVLEVPGQPEQRYVVDLSAPERLVLRSAD